MSQQQQQIIFRCIACGQRLGDFTPPVGGAAIKCPSCHEIMWLSVTSIPEYEGAETSTWYVRRWWGRPKQISDHCVATYVRPYSA